MCNGVELKPRSRGRAAMAAFTLARPRLQFVVVGRQRLLLSIAGTKEVEVAEWLQRKVYLMYGGLAFKAR
jgi:hypothetical protein